MNHNTPLLSMQVDPELGLAFVQEALSKAGLYVQRSFDFQVARASQVDCSCPHHGTDRCNCQWVVLLVYGQGSAPATLVVHGRDGNTRIFLEDTPQQRPDLALQTSILDALNPTSSDFIAPVWWAHAT